MFILILYGVYLRFQGLGYSNLQGDEINPVDYLGNIKGTTPSLNEFIPYLFEQKRGPVQYIINYINTSIFGYNNEFWIRFPFFIFGVLAFISFYYLAKKFFDAKSALWAVVFLAFNGLYIAFARITQYQSFMYFTVPISLFLYIKGFEERNYKIISLSGLLLSVNLLGHYDTLSVGPFFVGFLICNLLRNRKDLPYIIKSSAVFLIFFLLPALLFYVPFLKGSYYSESTAGYLGRRLEWSQLVPLTPLIMKILKMYAPLEVWFIILFFIVLAFLSFNKYVGFEKFLYFKIPKRLVKIGYILLVTIFGIGVIFSDFYIKPRVATLLVYVSSVGILLFLFLSKKVKPLILAITFWFLFALVFYFFFMKDPRTHVYVVFIPGFMLAGYGLSQFHNFLISRKRILFYGAYFLILCLLFYWSLINWAIFVDKNPEYPWWDKKVIGRTVFEIGRVRHQKIDGVFGFNQYRHWEEIRELFDQGCLGGTYNSNEKNSITKFYLGFDQTNPEVPDLVTNADTLVVVEGPHSWYYRGLKKGDIPESYSLIKTFYNGDYPVTYIWGKLDLYPNGNLLCN